MLKIFIGQEMKGQNAKYSADVLEGTILTCTSLHPRHVHHSVISDLVDGVKQIKFLHRKSRTYRHVSRHDSTRASFPKQQGLWILAVMPTRRKLSKEP